VNGQLSLFDSAEPLNVPRYREGDAIWGVVLDVVEEFKVSDTFSLGVDVFGERTEAGHTLWRHWLDRAGRRGHAVFGEYEMDGRWFDDADAAFEAAKRNRAAIDRLGLAIRTGVMQPSEPVSYLIERDGSFPVICQAARLGGCGVYEQRPCCYPFVRVFESTKDADRHYRKLAKELAAAGGRPTEFKAADAYRVSESLWAGYEYAERHGDWSVLREDAESPPAPMRTATDATAAPTKKKQKDHER
jgi:hypothetical protein